MPASSPYPPERAVVTKALVDYKGEFGLLLFAVGAFVLKVQEHWMAFTETVDQMVEKALTIAVTDSMRKLSAVINGNSRAVFKVLVELSQPAPPNKPKVPTLCITHS